MGVYGGKNRIGFSKSFGLPKDVILLFFLALWIGQSAWAQIPLELGDYRTISSGDYNNPAVWQRWDGAAWVAAITKPTQGNNIFIDQGHEIRLTANEAANHVYLFSAASPGRKLNLQSFELRVYGALRAMETIAGVFFLNNVTSLLTDWIYPETGRVVFKGTSRTVVERGSWSASNFNSRYTVVFDPEPGATLTVNAGFKANAFIIQSGTVLQKVNNSGTPICATFSYNNQTIFNGLNPYGDFVIESGATLVSECSAPLEQIIRRSAAVPGTLLHVKPGGNLVFLGNDPTLDVADFRMEGNVYYRSNSGTQRLVRKVLASAVKPNQYHNLLFENNALKQLPDTVFVAGDIALLNGGSITESPTYLRLNGDGMQQIINWNLNVAQVEVHKPSGTVLAFEDVSIKRNLIMRDGQVDFNGFDLFVNSAGTGGLFYEGGQWLNLHRFHYQNTPTTLSETNGTFPFEDGYQGGIRKVQFLGNTSGGNLRVRMVEIPGANWDPNFDDNDGTPILYQLNSYFEMEGLNAGPGTLEMRISADSLVVFAVEDLRIVSNGQAAPGSHLVAIDPDQQWARRTVALSEINGQSFTVGSFGPLSVLPLAWKDYEAIQNQNRITVTWSTLQEKENRHFSIHRSIGGISNFSKVGEVKSKGNSEGEQKYAFSYLESFAEKNVFFKICQHDLDGNSTCTPVFRIRGATEQFSESGISIWPNPYHSGELRVLFPRKFQTSHTMVSLSDYRGMLLFSERYPDGNWRTLLENLPPGMYLMRFSDNNYTETVRFWKH